MKPMKIMRYNGSFRYKQQRRRKILRTTLTLAAALAVIGAAVFAVIRFGGRPAPAEPAVQEDPAYAITNGSTSTVSMSVGEIHMLTLSSGADIASAQFVSDDTDVVRTDSAGRLDALKAGKALVTVEANGFSAECEVTVTEPAPEPEPDYDCITTAITANLDVVRKNSEKGTDDLYNITVNRRTNTVTVYTYDDKGEYTVPVRAMVASCGRGGADITPLGSYAIYFREPWHPLYGDVYGMYVSGFEGPYLFHSVPYYSVDHAQLETEEFNKLGSNVSQGCVRMMASDVRWIFRNCAMNTPVRVIDSESTADPLGTPPTVKLNNDLGWDPTDPNKKNPYKGKTPQISGADDAEIAAGESFDPMAGVKAADICGNDITDRMTLTGAVLTDKPGEYLLTYAVTDDFKLTTEVTRTVTVKGE